MAKYKYHLNGDFQKLYNYLKNEILNTSSSASLEEQEYLSYDNLKIGILVFERYSYTGGNRLSLNVTIVESNGEIDVIGISSGGSQALFFKINTIGEEAFLDKLKDALMNYRNQ